MPDKDTFPGKLYFILIIVLLLMIAGLFFAERQRSLRYIRKYKDERDREQAEQLSEFKKGMETSGTSSDNDEIITSLDDAVQKSLPGIVCWGDAVMKGTDTSSLPSELAQKVNDTLLGQVRETLIPTPASNDNQSEDADRTSDKAKSNDSKQISDAAQDEESVAISDTSKAENGEKTSDTDQMEDRLKIPVVNMGVAHEGFYEIMVRTGAHPLYLGEDFQIPEDTGKKIIVLCDEDGKSLRFAKNELDKFGQITIGKVKGHFYESSHDYDKHHSKLAFARDTKGKAVFEEEGTVLHTEGSEQYRKYLPIIFIREQEGVSEYELIAGIQDTVALYPRKQYVVLFPADKGSERDKTFQKKFNEHYIRVDKLPEDKDDSNDLTDEYYQELADRIYDNLDAQGAFDDITAAVESAERKQGKDAAGDD